MVRAGLAKGDDRYENAVRALELIAADVEIPDRRVMVKPNLVSRGKPLAVTHVDVVRATLEMLWGKGLREVTLAAGPAMGRASDAFDEYGYRSLAGDFNVEFFDLNIDDSVSAPIFDEQLRPRTLRMSKTLADSWVVSVCPMKTHNRVVVTLGLKNVLVGTLSGKSQKQGIHHGTKAINLSLAKMAELVGPDLVLLDGTVGMQGDGPVSAGYSIDSGVAVASADRIAADVVGLHVMGFELPQVGYLWYCMERRGLTVDDIEVLGETVDACRVRYEPHSDMAEQLAWPLEEDWRAVLERGG